MGIAVDLERRTGQALESMARYMVYFGGVMLSAIAILTVISISGRALVGFGLGPVPGDFELVEAGCAVAVFAFLPWCQLKRGHVSVDILTDLFPRGVQDFLALVGDIAIMLCSVVIAWRLWMGLGERVTWFSQPVRDVLGFGFKPFAVETTFILGMPVWYGYALGFIGAMLFALVSIYTVWRSFNILSSRAH